MAEIVTVRGPIAPDKLGITHPHEHVFVDVQVWMDEQAPRWLLKVPVSLEILADLKRRDGQNLDNAILDDFTVATSELLRFKKAGGRSLVDLTLDGIGRDPKRLLRIAKKTGINIVCGTGFYVVGSHPPLVKRKTIEELAEPMVSEIEEGIAGTEIRAGVIGEIGCGEPLHPEEAKVIAAAARAQARTRTGLTLHTALFDIAGRRAPMQVPQELEILQKHGADLSKVYVSHMDFTFDHPGYQRDLMERYGITLSYDTFGQEQYYDNIYFGAGGITDRERSSAIVEHLKNGFARQLLMSCDVCEKIHLRKYGGYGYANVLENVIPFLKLKGVSDRDITAMTVENPRRLLEK